MPKIHPTQICALPTHRLAVLFSNHEIWIYDPTKSDLDHNKCWHRVDLPPALREKANLEQSVREMIIRWEGGMPSNSKIKRARGVMGITQRDLASRLGISYSYMSQIECGARKPSWTVIEKMCKFFDLPVEDLMQ